MKDTRLLQFEMYVQDVAMFVEYKH